MVMRGSDTHPGRDPLRGTEHVPAPLFAGIYIPAWGSVNKKQKSLETEKTGTKFRFQTVDKVPANAGLFYVYDRFSDIIESERRCFL